MYPSEDWYFKRLTISSGAVGATGYLSSAVRSVDWHTGDQLDMKYYTWIHAQPKSHISTPKIYSSEMHPVQTIIYRMRKQQGPIV